MPTAFKEGDRVQILDRDATADDVKSSLFYNHFRGLIGTIQKLYVNDEAAIEIENSSLTEVIAQRHQDVQEKLKTDWLEKLSEEARNRLTPQERDFRLRYTILVRSADLIAPTAPMPVPAEPQRRLTDADLAAAEEAELRRRRNSKTT